MAIIPGNDLKPHIGIFGRMNVGKSSVINALTGRKQAIVSAVPGTTTDPVRKAMELGGLGPCVFIDTAGTDDSTELGRQRVDKSLEVLSEMDLALILFSENKLEEPELLLLERCRHLGIPCLLLHNKSDIQALNRAVLPAIEVVFRCWNSVPCIRKLPAGIIKAIRQLLLKALRNRLRCLKA